jgi:hypothetical protein
VTLEERVADRNDALALLVEAAWSLEQPAAAATPDLEADVVADDRGIDRRPELAAMPAKITAVSPGNGTPSASAATTAMSSG